MSISWRAVLLGFMTDLLLSLLCAPFVPENFAAGGALSQPELWLIGVLTLTTGIGGYVAGRLASERPWLHGLLVGAVGILFGQLQLMGAEATMPRPLVLASAVGCGLAALGGWRVFPHSESGDGDVRRCANSV